MVSNCEYCGKPLEDTKGRPKKFCNDSHKQMGYLKRQREKLKAYERNSITL